MTTLARLHQEIAPLEDASQPFPDYRLVVHDQNLGPAHLIVPLSVQQIPVQGDHDLRHITAYG
jgi:hypothetical protein